jgi:hypothetical protein
VTFEGKSHSATDGLSEVDETGHRGFGSRRPIDLVHCLQTGSGCVQWVPEITTVLADASDDDPAYWRQPALPVPV